jgi:hypothetical protein
VKELVGEGAVVAVREGADEVKMAEFGEGAGAGAWGERG